MIVKPGRGRCVYELRIPWSELGMSPALGAKFGLLHSTERQRRPRPRRPHELGRRPLANLASRQLRNHHVGGIVTGERFSECHRHTQHSADFCWPVPPSPQSESASASAFQPQCDSSATGRQSPDPGRPARPRQTSMVRELERQWGEIEVHICPGQGPGENVPPVSMSLMLQFFRDIDGIEIETRKTSSWRSCL